MGDIVEFQGLKSKSRRSDEPVPVAGAQILFFIGIRYERTEALAEPKAPRKRTPRSDTSAKGKPPRRLA
jgi:hypothetical protein